MVYHNNLRVRGIQFSDFKLAKFTHILSMFLRSSLSCSESSKTIKSPNFVRNIFYYTVINRVSYTKVKELILKQYEFSRILYIEKDS